MNTHHQAVVPRTSPWRFRIRIVTLITLLTMGLGIAAIERWRQEAFDQVWGVVHEELTHYFLTPISERTNRVFTVVSKIDRLLKMEEDNKRLQRDNTLLNVENQRLSEEVGRLGRLAGLGRWSGPADLSFLSADIAGLITSGQSAALIINRGRDHGVRPRDPVVALGGLVGIVQSVSSNTARVQTLMDPASAVGVMDRTSRARGVLFGPRNNNKLLEFMPENEVQPINIGGTLITSGFENSVYPKGIIVGTIQERKLNTYGIPYGIVKPAVSFEALEEVLLVIPGSRLAGREDATLTATLGSRHIFMPGSPMTADMTESGTATAQSPRPYDILRDVTVTTPSWAKIAGTSVTLPLTPLAPLLEDDNRDSTATANAVTTGTTVTLAQPKVVNQPPPVELLDQTARKKLEAIAKAEAAKQKRQAAKTGGEQKKQAAQAVDKKDSPPKKGRAPEKKATRPQLATRGADHEIGPGDLGE